jgi:hypothetical protein
MACRGQQHKCSCRRCPECNQKNCRCTRCDSELLSSPRDRRHWILVPLQRVRGRHRRPRYDTARLRTAVLTAYEQLARFFLYQLNLHTFNSHHPDRQKGERLVAEGWVGGWVGGVCASHRAGLRNGWMVRARWVYEAYEVKKKSKISLSCTSPEKIIFFHIYDVINSPEKKKALLITTRTTRTVCTKLRLYVICFVFLAVSLPSSLPPSLTLLLSLSSFVSHSLARSLSTLSHSLSRALSTNFSIYLSIALIVSVCLSVFLSPSLPLTY